MPLWSLALVGTQGRAIPCGGWRQCLILFPFASGAEAGNQRVNALVLFCTAVVVCKLAGGRDTGPVRFVSAIVPSAVQAELLPSLGRRRCADHRAGSLEGRLSLMVWAVPQDQHGGLVP